MGLYSFPKSEHLRRSVDIRGVFQTGQKCVGSFMVLYAKASPEGTLKAAFVVSKKIGKAALRNRAKRLMREAFRHEKVLFGKRYWLVFLARTGVCDWAYSKISEEMKQLSKKIK